MNDDIEQILIGSILGDAHLRLSVPQRSSNAHYEEIHSESQRAYLEWKADKYREFLPVKMTKRKYFDIRTKKTYTQVRLRMGVHPFLTTLYHSFYINRQKVVCPHYLRRLDSLGLAVWYMDDGSYCYQGKWAKLATCDFSLEDNLLIKEFLEERFGLKTTLYLHKWFQLYLNVQSTHILFSLIEPYVPECMSYKLGKDKHKESQARQKARHWEDINRIKRRRQNYQWREHNRERWLELKRNFYYRHRFPRTKQEIDALLNHINIVSEAKI